MNKNKKTLTPAVLILALAGLFFLGFKWGYERGRVCKFADQYHWRDCPLITVHWWQNCPLTNIAHSSWWYHVSTRNPTNWIVIAETPDGTYRSYHPITNSFPASRVF